AFGVRVARDRPRAFDETGWRTERRVGGAVEDEALPRASSRAHLALREADRRTEDLGGDGWRAGRPDKAPDHLEREGAARLGRLSLIEKRSDRGRAREESVLGGRRVQRDRCRQRDRRERPDRAPQIGVRGKIPLVERRRIAAKRDLAQAGVVPQRR